MSRYDLIGETGLLQALKERIADESVSLPALWQECKENPDHIASWKALAAYCDGESAFIKSILGD